MEKIALDTENLVLELADINKRKHILITDKEQIRPRGYDDTQYIKWINYNYVETFKQAIPYHYVITTDGTLYSAKEDFTATKVGTFPGYENDIIIYVEGNLKKTSATQKSALELLCAFVCRKYFMNTESIVYYPYDILNDDSVANYKTILKQSIIVSLEAQDGSNIVQNSFLKEEKESGDGIGKIKFISIPSEMTIKELSEMTGIPQNILLQQNQHLI